MKNTLLAGFMAGAGLLLASGTLLAHHSDSIWDQSHLITITGTVTQFAFVNPHTEIHLSVKSAKGQQEDWVALGGAPNQMRAIGWTSHRFQPGDQLTIVGFQYRDGRRAILHLKMFRSSGEEVALSPIEGQFLKNYEDAHGKGKYGYKPEPE